MSERRTRVRFAPSPTGPLHMGGVRTALYNYLYAKQKGGDFIIRIEDTDSRRFVPGAEQYIIEALNWCGILADEGVEDGRIVETPSAKHPHAPYRQSQRRGIYREYAEELVEKGAAYYAFDTAESLADARTAAEARGETFIYNQSTRKTMRNSLTLPESEVQDLLEHTSDWTVRFKMPEDTVVRMDDLIRGHIEVNTDTLDDKVLWKRADELPTYHLANIVDDHLMEVTEVIRGEEWLPSLPLHYLLYRAFGWEDTMPRFAHLSLLLKPDGKGKLSKRDGDKLGFPVFPLQWVNSEGETYRGYREDGYFPEAFVNMLAFLGWNPGEGDNREILSMQELVESFSLDHIVKSGARFNAEKARWYNKEYLRMKSDEELAGQFVPVLESHGLNVVECPVCARTAGAEFQGCGADFRKHIYLRDYVQDVISFTKERATFTADFWNIAPCLFVAPAEFEAFGLPAPFAQKDVDKFWKPENVSLVKQLGAFIVDYAGEWSKEGLETAMENYIRENGWPMGKVMNTTRLALAGAASGLGIADIVYRIGKAECARRIESALTHLA